MIRIAPFICSFATLVSTTSVCLAQVRYSQDARPYFEVIDLRFYVPESQKRCVLDEIVHPASVVRNGLPHSVESLLEQQLDWEGIRTALNEVRLNSKRHTAREFFTYHVEWELYPKTGGMTGIAPSYTASFEARTGKLLQPQVAVISNAQLDFELQLHSELTIAEPFADSEESKIEWGLMQRLANRELARFCAQKRLETPASENFQERGSLTIGKKTVHFVEGEYCDNEIRFFFLSPSVHSRFSVEAIY